MARNQQLHGIGRKKMRTHEMGGEGGVEGERWVMMVWREKGWGQEEAAGRRGMSHTEATWWRSALAHSPFRSCLLPFL